jgi:hypothetical protein
MGKIDRKRLLPRQHNWRESKLFIIAVEGEVTEKEYFSIFQSTRVQVKVLHTTDGESAPDYVFDRLAEFNKKYDLDEDDELWLVFDVDRWGSEKLSRICREARQKNYKLAISNPCFEVWLCLHFQPLDRRDKTCKHFKARWRGLFAASGGNESDIEVYKSNIQNAIALSKASTQSDQEYWPSSIGTHVYKLAESILVSMK